MKFEANFVKCVKVEEINVKFGNLGKLEPNFEKFV
jgi:hypothetical protein